jgi:hypothetical protein
MAQSFYLREQAERCRRLARGTAEYDAQADAQDASDEEAPAVRYGSAMMMKINSFSWRQPSSVTPVCEAALPDRGPGLGGAL